MPANLRDDIARHKRAIREAILARTGATQLALDLPAATPLGSFMDREDARFVALCTEYGLNIGPYVPTGSTGHAA